MSATWSGDEPLLELYRALRPGGVLLLDSPVWRRKEVLTALVAAGFRPRWCDVGMVSAVRDGGAATPDDGVAVGR